MVLSIAAEDLARLAAAPEAADVRGPLWVLRAESGARPDHWTRNTWWVADGTLRSGPALPSSDPTANGAGAAQVAAGLALPPLPDGLDLRLLQEAGRLADHARKALGRLDVLLDAFDAESALFARFSGPPPPPPTPGKAAKAAAPSEIEGEQAPAATGAAALRSGEGRGGTLGAAEAGGTLTLVPDGPAERDRWLDALTHFAVLAGTAGAVDPPPLTAEGGGGGAGPGRSGMEATAYWELARGAARLMRGRCGLVAAHLGRAEAFGHWGWRELLALAAGVRTLRVARGEAVFEGGAEAAGVYMLHEGDVRRAPRRPEVDVPSDSPKRASSVALRVPAPSAAGCRGRPAVPAGGTDRSVGGTVRVLMAEHFAVGALAPVGRAPKRAPTVRIALAHVRADARARSGPPAALTRPGALLRSLWHVRTEEETEFRFPGRDDLVLEEDLELRRRTTARRVCLGTCGAPAAFGEELCRLAPGGGGGSSGGSGAAHRFALRVESTSAVRGVDAVSGLH